MITQLNNQINEKRMGLQIFENIIGNSLWNDIIYLLVYCSFS